MVIRCLGWTKPQHAPILIGVKEPVLDVAVTDGMCSGCRAELARRHKARERVRLTAHLRNPARTISGVYDRLGAALRLRWLRRENRADLRAYEVGAA